METEIVLIKIEPKDEFVICADGLNVFDITSQKYVKPEVNLHVEYLPTNYNNEEINENAILNCKSEPIDSFNNETSASTNPKIKIEDVFDKEDLVDLSKLNQLLNQSKTILDCNNINHENKEFDENSVYNSSIGKESSIKKEEKGYDITEDALQLYESKLITLSNDQNVQEYSENSDADEKIDISEVTLQSSKLTFGSKEGSNKQKTSASRKSMIKPHKKEIKTKMYKCKLCSYQSKFKSALNRHIRLVHDKNRTKINCEFCEKTFAIQHSLDDHLLKQHEKKVNSKIYTCSSCSYKTITKALFNRHFSIHNDQRSKIKCTFCDRLFTVKPALDNHLLKKHIQKVKGDMESFITSKIHKCKMCSYESTHKGSLTIHINRVHKKQKTEINCKFCGKTFGRKRSVDDHMLRQHRDKLTKTNIYKCGDCSYETTIKYSLTRHIQTHQSTVTKAQNKP